MSGQGILLFNYQHTIMKKYVLLLMLFAITVGAFAQVADSAKRKVNLQGAVNFRDLGGYTTKDGHHVKWRKIYRSADMSKLTDADLAELRARNIAYDVDLRGTQESAQAPDKLNPGTDYILLPAGSDNINWASEMSKLKGYQADSLMIAFYSNTDPFTARYKPFFDKLLGLPEDKSLVFHCSAGKDRTGMGAALLLYALGVPYNTIVDDYLASNYYRRNENAKLTAQMMQFMKVDEQVAKSMAGVKKEYIDATFAGISKKYGSVDNFLRDQIGLDNKKMALLRKKFLD